MGVQLGEARSSTRQPGNLRQSERSDGGGLVSGGLTALRRSLLLLAVYPLEVLILVLVSVSLSLIPIGVGFLMVPTALSALRAVANMKRRRAGQWSGTAVEVPYLPTPELRPGLTGRVAEAWWLLKDPSTWRDIAWLFMDMLIGAVVVTIAPGIIAGGLWGMVVLPVLYEPVMKNWSGVWYLFIHVQGGPEMIAVVVCGLLLLPIGLALAPGLLQAYSRYIAWALGPTERTRLAGRVQQLSRTRTETLDSSAAELRRIERDLHDGAQARLVAMGMTLSTAQAVLRSDPEMAETLLAEAKDTSAKALSELRDLVRGIHPPVLADRGLGDAVRALAQDCPLPVRVGVSIPQRCGPAIESAAYFAVSELLANAVKHAGASHVTIDLRVVDGELRIRVDDDGVGGADPDSGSGLRGIERRLAAFDGGLAVNSPAGGPTSVGAALRLDPALARTAEEQKGHEG